MNHEIRCITNEEKIARNAWENDDSNCPQALYSIFLYTLLAIHHPAASYKYFKKLISEV